MPTITPESKEKLRQTVIRNNHSRLWAEYKTLSPVCKNCSKEIPFDVWKSNKAIKSCSMECRCSLNRKTSKSWIRDTKFRETMSLATKKSWVKNAESMNKILQARRYSSKGERDLRHLLKSVLGDKEVLAHRHIRISENCVRAVDMWIPSKNTIIEYDGECHFSNIFGNLKDIQEKDRLTDIYCALNDIQLLRISDMDYSKDKTKTLARVFNFLNISISD